MLFKQVSKYEFTLEYLILFIIILLIRIIFKNCNKNLFILSVIPLSTDFNNTDHSSNNSENNIAPSLTGSGEKETEETEEEEEELNNIWDPNTNFKDLSQQNKFRFINQMILIKGLTPNNFLIQYFIGAILENTSGDKSDVLKFLNTNLSTILTDTWNNQLNTHSFIRTKPYLLYNSNNSLYPNTVPFKLDNSFLYELEENKKETKK